MISNQNTSAKLLVLFASWTAAGVHPFLSILSVILFPLFVLLIDFFCGVQSAKLTVVDCFFCQRGERRWFRHRLCLFTVDWRAHKQSTNRTVATVASVASRPCLASPRPQLDIGKLTLTWPQNNQNCWPQCAAIGSLNSAFASATVTATQLGLWLSHGDIQGGGGGSGVWVGASRFAAC